MPARLCACAAMIAVTACAFATDLPIGFEEHLVLDGLVDPAVMAFAPDGRLFIGERIQGRLRVAVPDGDGWTLLPEPFATFDVPADEQGNPVRHRSSGLRGFAFDPDFAQNGHVYVFYMKNDPRHNRLVRITASAGDPNVAAPGETLLFEMPFNASESSGSHNGGAVAFGPDGMLYVTTGDGWNGGDDVQSLATYTGKVFRLGADGTIPTDNPFFDEAAGDGRAVYALGMRNPYSISTHPETGALYVNDVAGSNKANVYALAAGANFGHDGYGGIGEAAGAWADAGFGLPVGRVVTGGAWYPACGPFPAAYHGACFVTLWGGNGTGAGSITMIASDRDPTVTAFATNIGFDDPAETNKPVSIATSDDGRVVYLASSYEADTARIMEIRSTAPPVTDLNGDGSVDFTDLLTVLSSWGDCAPGLACPGDVDGDCAVDFQDLLALLATWS